MISFGRLLFLLWSCLFSVPINRWSVRRWMDAEWRVGRLTAIHLVSAGIAYVLAAGAELSSGSPPSAVYVMVATMCVLIGWQASRLAATTSGQHTLRAGLVGATSTFVALAIAWGVVLALVFVMFWRFIMSCC